SPPAAHVSPLPLHDALPIWVAAAGAELAAGDVEAVRREHAHRIGEGGELHRRRPTAAAVDGLRRVQRRALAALNAVVEGQVRGRSEEHTSELQSLAYLVCRL